MTDTGAQQLLTSVLRDGEQLVWWQAAPSEAAPGAWIAAIGLTLLATFAGALAFSAARSKRSRMTVWQISAFASVFSAVPMFVAIYFWVQAIGGLDRAYGITNTRVMIVDNNPWLWVESFGPDEVMTIDRRGDIVRFNYGRTKGGNAYRTHLRGLKEPEQVELLIIQHVRGGAPPTEDESAAGAPP